MKRQLVVDLIALLLVLGSILPPVNPLYGYIRRFGKRDLHARAGAFYNEPGTYARLIMYYGSVLFGFVSLVTISASRLTGFTWVVDPNEQRVVENPNLLVIGLVAALLVLTLHLVEGISAEGLFILTNRDKFPRFAALLVERRKNMLIQVPLWGFSVTCAIVLASRAYYIFMQMV